MDLRHFAEDDLQGVEQPPHLERKLFVGLNPVTSIKLVAHFNASFIHPAAGTFRLERKMAQQERERQLNGRQR